MKRILSLFAICIVQITLCSCGFSPIYNYDAAQSLVTSDMYIAPISGTNGIELRNLLRAKFDTDNRESAQYTLRVNMGQPQTIYKAIQTTGDATWQEVRMTATYTLIETESDQVILSATDSASESYTFVRDLVAAQASYTNAVQSTLRVLSEKISTRVNAKLVTEK